MVETLGSRRSTGRKRNLRSPSPAPSPRSPKSPLPAPSLLSSPLPSPSPLPSHSSNHVSSKNRTPKEQSPEEEVMQTNEHKQLPASKEVKSIKVEPSKEGVNQTSDSIETDQGRKVKPNPHPPTTTTSKTAASSNTSATNDIRNLSKNNFHRLSRKRERTPSPTPSVPGPKRRANSPTSQTVNTPTSDVQPPPNPKPSHPTSRPLSGTNNSLKLPGAVRLVKPEMSSASKVLNEEIQKQQGQENARLKQLIFKEVKKQGKSEHVYIRTPHIVLSTTSKPLSIVY